ncbi:hypothetical protein BN439_2640 [Erwinia amylovora Ea644]|nr:hypothetical protein BN439_2640 [Erwinia amylovora Ea644]CCP07731.1 hypothetical protein BN440_2717 [Erwinia amylovora MR1]
MLHGHECVANAAAAASGTIHRLFFSFSDGR